jgi:putative membrane protein
MTQLSSIESETPPSGRARILGAVLLAVQGLLLAAHASLHLYNIVTDAPPAKQVPWVVLTLVFSGAMLAHAIYGLGWRRGLTMFACAAIIGFVFEFIGVKTGLIYGAYYYTDVLGPKILGAVPVVIPIAYFMSVYPCYLMTNLLIRGQPVITYPRLRAVVLASVATGLLVTGWDLIMDPLVVDEVRAWVWVNGGPYFGVPFQNFAGWVLAISTIMTAYRLVEPRIPLQPLGQVSRWFIALPLLGWALNGVADFFVGYPIATRIIGPFTICAPVLASLLSLYRPKASQE